VADRAEPHSPFSERAGILLVLAAGLILRVWHLGARSVWTDEGSTWTAATLPLRELIRFCAEKDASPPLYYLLTSLALRFGDGEAPLRMVSVLASVGLVWLTYRIARLHAGTREATLAAALVALSPFQLLYAQEARTYALVACFAVLALYLFARAVLFDRRRAWLPLIGASALALYTQSIALLGMGVQGALAAGTAAGRRRFGRWTLAQAIAFALYLPWMIVSLGQAGQLAESHWYLRPPDPHGVFQVLRAAFLAPIPLVHAGPGAPAPGLDHLLPEPLAQALLVMIPLVPLLLALPALRERGARGQVARLAFAGVALPLAAVLAVSRVAPLWLPRYFVLLTPMIAVAQTIGFQRMRPSGLARAWVAALLLLQTYACVRVDWDYGKERWREVVATIAAESPAGRAAVLVPFDVDAFRFYDAKLPHPVAVFEVSHPDVPFDSDYTPRQLAEMEREARARVAGHDEVWVVARRPNSAIRAEVGAMAERVAAADRRLVSRTAWESIGGPLDVSRYRRATSTRVPPAAPPSSTAPPPVAPAEMGPG